MDAATSPSYEMSDLNDLKDVADLIIRRVLAEATDPSSLAEALNRANPFGDDPYGRQLWLEAILRNAYKLDKKEGPKKPM